MREKLVRAILAFDAIFQELISDIEAGKEPCSQTKALMGTLNGIFIEFPDLTQEQIDFIFNLAYLTSRIRTLTLLSEPDKELLDEANKKILHRIRMLAALQESETIPIAEVNEFMH